MSQQDVFNQERRAIHTATDIAGRVKEREAQSLSVGVLQLWRAAHESSATALQTQLPEVKSALNNNKALVDAISSERNYQVPQLVKEDLSHARKAAGDFSLDIKPGDKWTDPGLGTNRQNAIRAAELRALDDSVLKLCGNRLTPSEVALVGKDMGIQSKMTDASLVDQVAKARDAKHDERFLKGIDTRDSQTVVAVRGSILNDKIGRFDAKEISIEKGGVKTEAAKEQNITDAIESSKAVAELANKLLPVENRTGTANTKPAIPNEQNGVPPLTDIFHSGAGRNTLRK